MKRKLILAVLLTYFSGHAFADWDAKLEAEEAAKKKAEQQKAAAEKAKTDAMMKDLNNKAQAEQAAQDKKSVASMRKDLGKQANGKSDAEVKAMWTAKAQKDAKDIQQQEKESRPVKDAQMKKMYGKDTKDLMNMSDEELEAFSKDVEKKYNH
jgi:hypothetical protein